DPTSYPTAVCNVADYIHHGHSSFATYVCIVALVPSSLPSPDAPSPPVPAPVHVIETPMDVPPPNNSQTHQTVTECHRITIPHPTPETSTSAPPLSYTFPSAATSPRIPASNLSLAPNLVPYNILPTCPPQSSHLPTTRSDLLPSCPESHRPIIVTISPGASLAPTSSPNLGATAERDGSPNPGLCKEMAVLDLPSVNRAICTNTVATIDIPPQSPSPPLSH
ncbi:hypothetical protein EDB83DRAFT_2452417, partial [Lactarius deliciosus]